MAQKQTAKEINETHNLLGSCKESESSSLRVFSDNTRKFSNTWTGTSVILNKVEASVFA